MLLILLLSQMAFGETLASSVGTTTGTAVSTHDFDAAGIQTLFGSGTLPKFSHLENKYRTTRQSKHCKGALANIKSKTVQKRHVTPDQVEQLRQKATAQGFNEKHVRRALASFLANQDEIPNQRYVTFIDFNKRSNAKRMVIIDLANLSLKSYHVAAGSGTDRNGDGYAERFSNGFGTNASSLGCALANGRFRDGKGRKALLFHGMEASNDNMCARGAFMHTAGYVGGVPGRSWGCPSVKSGEAEEIYGKLNGGGLVCSYFDGPQARETAGRPAKPSKKARGRYARRR